MVITIWEGCRFIMINVLSLFDGMSCGRIALDRTGIKVNKYYASELDKYAIKVTQSNWPETIQLGDVNNWREWNIDWSSIDLLIGGSPCQGFSFAGKQLAFDDPRSKLFFVYVNILNHIRSVNPDIRFLLENVKMKKEYLDIISDYIGVEPVFINSALVSAQNRQRYYWVNWEFGQPEDRNIMLSDIIEHGVVDRDKSFCIDANYWKGGNLKSYFEKHRRQLVFELSKINNRIKDVTISKEGVRPHRGDVRKSGISELGNLMTIETEKTYAMTTSHAPKLIIHTSERGRRLTSDGTKRDDKNGTIVRGYEVSTDGKTCALTTVQKDNYVTEDFTIRKLTPIECERLQTVPDSEKCVIITLCLDQIKNFVNAVNRSPKLQKLVSSAEALKLNEYVKNAASNTQVNHQLEKNTVQRNAGMQTQKQTEQCINQRQEDLNSPVEIVGSEMMFKYQNTEAGSAILNVFMSSIEGRITHYGSEALHQNGRNYTYHRSGRSQLNLYGAEMMQLAEDVEKNLNTKKSSNFTSTISNLLNTSNLEQMLIISYYCASLAIDGFIPKRTLRINLSLIDGYTSCVSNTQRYKMIGNGWTVDVIAHIFKALNIPVSFL